MSSLFNFEEERCDECCTRGVWPPSDKNPVVFGCPPCQESLSRAALPRIMRPEDLLPWDDVRVTGMATDGVSFEGLKCVVATVSLGTKEEENLSAIKVWPISDEDPAGARYGGKIWFYMRDIKYVELLRRTY
jgi:hypothetical protein